MTMETLLDIQNLHVWYRVYGGYLKVLNGVNFTVNKGERVGLVGEAGCGKTTTMKTVLRVLPYQVSKIAQGQIMFKGRDILQMNGKALQNVRSKGIAMIFQDPSSAQPGFHSRGTIARRDPLFAGFTDQSPGKRTDH